MTSIRRIATAVVFLATPVAFFVFETAPRVSY
jgi:hypothetical protein